MTDAVSALRREQGRGGLYTASMLLVLASAFWMQAVPPDAAGEHARGVELYKRRQYVEAAKALERAAAAERQDTPAYRESILLLSQSLYLAG